MIFCCLLCNFTCFVEPYMLCCYALYIPNCALYSQPNQGQGEDILACTLLPATIKPTHPTAGGLEYHPGNGQDGLWATDTIPQSSITAGEYYPSIALRFIKPVLGHVLRHVLKHSPKAQAHAWVHAPARAQASAWHRHGVLSQSQRTSEGSRNIRKSAKVVTISLEEVPPPRQLVTA